MKRTNLAALIESHRWARRITVRDLAKELGMSPATVNRYERGVGDLSGRDIGKLLVWLFAKEKV